MAKSSFAVVGSLFSDSLLGISYAPERCQRAAQVAQQYGLPLASALANPPPYLLHFAPQQLELHATQSKEKPLSVDFVHGKSNHRRLYGGGKGQDIAKAVGANKYRDLNIIDATAGLAGDAFVLATLGCRVAMIERALPAFLLVNDALQRALLSAEPDVLAIVQRLSLMHGSAQQVLTALDAAEYPHVIYLDPMFPKRTKSAKVKKEMSILHELIGADADSAELLKIARHRATKRIVVKRPRLAPALADARPDFQITGKTTRYDVYLPITSPFH